eukprot:GHVQ01027642.1.p1 GENE.GHVQ01027642.1~~GHVQ01027642.1.p1  ORF type:complete len:285 (-),score=52.53 GHVQ01027642.1:196-1050(-)
MADPSTSPPHTHPPNTHPPHTDSLDAKLPNGHIPASPCSSSVQGTGQVRLNRGLAEMLKGGVIMDVMNVEQARIAEAAGAAAVMALERIPADIRVSGGVARMSDPKMIREIMDAVSIPVMAKCRIGHFVEAQVLDSVGVDFIDESEVLTIADDENHIYKRGFKIPFVCGCRNLGEALRRVGEGAVMIRTKGEAGTGNIVEAVKHIRQVNRDIARLKGMGTEEVNRFAKDIGASLDLLMETRQLGRLPVVNFAAGGVATPAGRYIYAYTTTFIHTHTQIYNHIHR